MIDITKALYVVTGALKTDDEELRKVEIIKINQYSHCENCNAKSNPMLGITLEAQGEIFKFLRDRSLLMPGTGVK